ncbi:MAG: type IV conjugative transfer system protein TraE [Rickettsiaceae bacterium]|nr:type IV conjugative transfer system protein TraE [Rickettsiaceae bacterium]
MDIKAFHSNLKALNLQRNYSICLNVFLAFTLVITLLVILKRSNLQTTIVIPAGLSERVRISQSGVDEPFLNQWTEFLTALKLNITPDTAILKQNTLLKYVDSGQYGAIKAHLASEFEKIKKDEISTVFFPSETKVINMDNLVTNISGVLKVYIGEELNKSEKLTYELKFKYDSGRLLLTSFKEVGRV